MSKQIGSTKVDLHRSVVKLARTVRMHHAQLLYGVGQGGIFVAAYAKPALLEQALATRNVQVNEACSLGQAWGGVHGAMIQNPRVAKKGIGTEKLSAGAPELFSTSCPVP